MKVKELINELMNYNQELEVVTNACGEVTSSLETGKIENVRIVRTNDSGIIILDEYDHEYDEFVIAIQYW